MIAVNNSSSQNVFIKEVFTCQTHLYFSNLCKWNQQVIICSTKLCNQQSQNFCESKNWPSHLALKMWDLNEGIWKLYLMHFPGVADVIPAGLFSSSPHWGFYLFNRPIHAKVMITGTRTQKEVLLVIQTFSTKYWKCGFILWQGHGCLQSCHYQKKKNCLAVTCQKAFLRYK